MSLWNDEELRQLFRAQTPLIDVRAPVEFKDGFIPYSVNLPILSDDERAQVGTTYKEQGQPAAIELGQKLVSGSVKIQRVAVWKKFIQANPNAEVFCFRGGLRSQTTCQWLKEEGITRTPIAGGYKRLRNFFISILNDAPLPKIIRVAGPTGSGKTHFLKTFENIVDLEGLANHRGSAFGSMGPQPTQITFENHLALELLKLEGKTILMEDESATIGKITVPRRLFSELRNSQMVVLEMPLETRIANIHADYVKPDSLLHLLSSLERIQKSLGGPTYKIVKDEIEAAFRSGMEVTYHANWIGMLLKLYYDPHYFRSLERQADLVLMKGSPEEVRAWLTKENLH